MYNWSNFDILRLLQQEPGRLKQFLQQVPLPDLQAAVQEKQRTADQRYRHSREQFAYKKNVLDMNLDEVIRNCYQEKIINFFQHKLAQEKSRIQNHPEFGYKLVTRLPEKYFVGQRSAHFNRAKEIESAYGIVRNGRNTGNRNENDEANYPGQESGQNDDEYEEEEYLNENEEDRPQDQDQQDEEESRSQSSNDSFIADSEEIDEDFQIDDSVQEQIRNQRRSKQARKYEATEEKLSKTYEKQEILEKTTQRKLKKSAQEEKQEIQLDEEYIIKPTGIDLVSEIQTQRAKRNQKKLKQEFKRLQSSAQTKPSFSNTKIYLDSEEEQEKQEEFLVQRKTKKMHLDLD